MLHARTAEGIQRSTYTGYLLVPLLCVPSSRDFACAHVLLLSHLATITPPYADVQRYSDSMTQHIVAALGNIHLLDIDKIALNSDHLTARLYEPNVVTT